MERCVYHVIRNFESTSRDRGRAHEGTSAGAAKVSLLDLGKSYDSVCLIIIH